MSTLTALAAPALVLLAVVVPFLSYHEYSLLLPESLALLAGAIAVGMLMGAVSLLRPQTLGVALTAVTICVYIYYRPEMTDRLILSANNDRRFKRRIGRCARLHLRGPLPDPLSGLSNGRAASFKDRHGGFRDDRLEHAHPPDRPRW